MKTLFALLISVHLSAFAQSNIELLNEGRFTIQNVKVNSWLSKIGEALELHYDFSENVSYIYEDSDKITRDCGYDSDFEAGDYKLVWKKATSYKGEGSDRKRKTIAYIAYLVVETSGAQKNELKFCNVVRDVYTVSTSGNDLTEKLNETYYKKAYKPTL